MSVILKKGDYITKSLEILSDGNYYRLLNRDPTSTYQQKANKIVSKLKNKKLLTSGRLDNLPYTIKLHLSFMDYKNPQT